MNDSLVGKYILVKYDLRLTTGTVHHVVEDDPKKDWISVEDNRHFYRKAVLLAGTKEEMELASKEHQKILDSIRANREKEQAELKNWLLKNAHYKRD